VIVREEVLTTADADRWRAALPADTCVMGCVELARIMEQRHGHAARLYVVDWGTGRIAYPYHLRPVEPLPFAGPLGRGLFDTFTPEYTGPILVGAPPEGGLGALDHPARFARHAAAQGIVAEFAHLNPFHAADDLRAPGCTAVDREVVWIDLTWGEARLWKESFSSDARRMVRQAVQAGVRVRSATTSDEVLAFHRLHAATMRRRAARADYSLPPEYFLSVVEQLPGNAMILVAEYQGAVVAGGLLLHDATDVYWHLSAADLAASHARPVNGYVHEMVRWAVRAGKRRLLCGGGYAPGDGVFRFKASLSPLRARFQVYRRVLAPASYAALCAAWTGRSGGAGPGTYFPAYRSPLAADRAVAPDDARGDADARAAAS
jgi:hypothetical protein